MLMRFFRCRVSAFKTRRELALENLVLWQQLAVLRRSVKRPRLSDFDRGFWVSFVKTRPATKSETYLPFLPRPKS